MGFVLGLFLEFVYVLLDDYFKEEGFSFVSGLFVMCRSMILFLGRIFELNG